LARALFHAPKLLLADEPTGNLDEENAGIVLTHLTEYARNGGTVVMVTHNVDAAGRADRTLRIQNGRTHSLDRP
jgi:ABC-type lipoprotein export system ATPase subunit